MRYSRQIRLLLAPAGLCTPALTLAHPGHGPHEWSWAAGLLHLLPGLGIGLAAIAVGLWVVRRRGRDPSVRV